MLSTIANDRDDISLFLPGLSIEEREKRVLLRGYRNAATAMIASTESNNARALAWMANDYVTGSLYNTGATYALDDLNKLCRRLMLTAMQAEEIDLERFAA